MDGSEDNLRTILAQNIKKARETLHLTQSNLAENANISLFSVIDIERRRTWVSDRTLINIAKALNKRPYELLTPAENQKTEDEARLLPLITELIGSKKSQLRESSDRVMDELTREIIRLF